VIVNLTRNVVIASRVRTAQDPWQRMKGLLGTREFPQGEALVITHCQSIHMFFMKFPIDVVFCDQHNKVVGLCSAIRPFQLSPIFFKASYAIELPSGSIASSNTKIGDKVKLN